MLLLVSVKPRWTNYQILALLYHSRQRICKRKFIRVGAGLRPGPSFGKQALPGKRAGRIAAVYGGYRYWKKKIFLRKSDFSLYIRKKL